MSEDGSSEASSRGTSDSTSESDRNRGGLERRSYLSTAAAGFAALGVGPRAGSAASGTDEPAALAGGGASADLDPVADITEFGADPSDPNHDDAGAYNEAVRAVAEAGGGSITLPEGTITFDSGLEHEPVLDGDGGNEDGIAGFGVHGRGSDATTVRASVEFSLNGPNRHGAFRNFELSGMTLDYTEATNQNTMVNTVDGFVVSDVDIVGSGDLRNVSGLWRNGIWKDSTLRDGTMDYGGLFDVQATNVVFRNVTCTGSSTAGFWHNASENVVHLDCEVAECNGSGISGENSPSDIAVIGGSYHHNGMRGLGTSGLSVFDAHLHDNSQDPGSDFDEMWGNVAIGNRIEGGSEIYVAATGNTPSIDTE